jgi:hypothetical protein
MRKLGSMQQRIVKSNLPENQNLESSMILDDICMEILDRRQVLARIAERSSSSIEECVSLLKLTAAGTFTEGRAANFARSRATEVMQMPSFAEDLSRQYTDRAEMRQMLLEFVSLLTKAGVEDLRLMKSIVSAQADT